MTEFLNWPLESQLVMALIAIGLISLLGSQAMQNSGGVARKGEDGYWELTLPRARWLQVLGVSCIAAVISVAAVYTRDSPKWTPEENAWNQQLGYMLAGGAWIAVVALFVPWHGANYKFNETEFVAAPFFGRTRAFPWTELQDMGTDYWGAFVTFRQDTMFRVPATYSGAMQLRCQIDCRTLNAKRPVSPIFDEMAKELPGKSVRVDTFRPGYNGLCDFVGSNVGRFESVTSAGIVVALDLGQRLELAANLRGMAVRNDDVDEVDEDGVVTSDCVLVIWEGDGQWVEPPKMTNRAASDLERV